MMMAQWEYDAGMWRDVFRPDPAPSKIYRVKLIPVPDNSDRKRPPLKVVDDEIPF
jgi:hypothetical protein